MAISWKEKLAEQMPPNLIEEIDVIFRWSRRTFGGAFGWN